MNLKQIIFLQRQIRKFLSSKKNQNKLFVRPPQTKPKSNYLFLNNTNNEINLNNENTNYIENNENTNNNLQNETENKNSAKKENDNLVQTEINQKSQEDDSILNNELTYVENLRIQNATYTGEVHNGKRHGKGIQIWDDGAKYEGNWENDKSNGYGTFYHTDGDVYQGYWKNNRANGKGVYISSDGGRYEGFWIDDVQNGFGCFEIRNCSMIVHRVSRKSFFSQRLCHTQAMLWCNADASDFRYTEAGGYAGQFGIEIVYQFFVFGRIGGYKSVALFESPVLRELQPIDDFLFVFYFFSIRLFRLAYLERCVRVFVFL